MGDINRCRQKEMLCRAFAGIEHSRAVLLKSMMHFVFFASARGLFTHLNSVTPAGFSCDQEHLKQTDSKTISFEAHWFVYLIVLLVFHWLLW
jgi:hypothetical protein